jgi:hypothetical protein
VFGTAESDVAFSVPIPVLLEPTRTLRRNLLTRGTVLGQPHWRSNEAGKDSRQNPTKSSLFVVLKIPGEQAGQKMREKDAEIYFVSFFQPLRQSSQSFSVALHIALDALCSQRPFLFAKSRLTSGIACSDPKCMLAVSQPIE